MSNPSLLTNDFEPCSAKAWKQKIQFDLKGADYNSTLLTATDEGITIKPFYHSDTFEKVEVPPTKSGVAICEQIRITNETTAQKRALNALEKGADALKFIATAPFDIETLFKGLLGKGVPFHLQLTFLSETFVEELQNLLRDEQVFYNLDVVGNLVKTGNWFQSMRGDFKILEGCLQRAPSGHLLSVNSGLYQNAGANTVQQVAYALAHANEYLTRFGSEVAARIQFNVAMGSHYFFEIAKLRALRYLYNLVLTSYHTETDVPIFASPSLRNKTLYDYNVNMLRSTTESMSALLGGANTVANSPYDILFHEENEFGQRISRNQLLILKEESYFKNAQEISRNAYYIESITKQIAEKALAIFKDIEKSGGFLQQLHTGTIQRKIAENAQKEQARFEANEQILVGTNKYIRADERMKGALEKNPFLPRNPKKTLIAPILPKRLSETREQKRIKDEA